jgi:hypothetical protein
LREVVKRNFVTRITVSHRRNIITLCVCVGGGARSRTAKTPTNNEFYLNCQRLPKRFLDSTKFGEFKNSEEEERSLLEAATKRRLVKTEKAVVSYLWRV